MPHLSLNDCNTLVIIILCVLHPPPILSFPINRNMFPENLVQACFQQVKVHPSFISVPLFKV